MDPVTGVAASATSLSAIRERQELGVAVIRKERDAREAAAQLLIQNVEAASPAPTLRRGLVHVVA